MATVYIDGVVFKTNLNNGQVSKARAEINASRIIAGKLRKRMKSAISKSPQAYALARSEFLKSHDVFLDSTVKANMRRRENKRSTLERCMGTPSILQVQCPLKEPSVVRPRLKKNGGFRPLHDFGLHHRTAQQIVNQVIECRFVPRDFQYTFKGPNRAIREIKKLLKQELVYFATLDIKDHFGSFDPEKLVSVLPLPKEWVLHVVVGRHIAGVADIHGGIHAHLVPMDILLILARRGIPQGSASSPIVAAYCIAHLQWNSLLGTALLNYADNFLVLAASEKEMEEAIEKLVDAVGKLPGGHFELKLVSKGHADKGLDFLGHHIVRVPPTQIRTAVSLLNQQSMIQRLRRSSKKVDAALSQGNKLKALGHLRSMCSSLKGWVRAFRECDDIKEWEASLLAMVHFDSPQYPSGFVEFTYQSAPAEFEYDAREYDFI